MGAILLSVEQLEQSVQKTEQDAEPQTRPRWRVGGLTGGGDVVEVVEVR